jgi:tetratricopeptide (TPR) repeat protein
LDLLKEDALETIRKGSMERNDFALAVGKRSLGTYLARTGKPERSLIYLEDAITCFLKEGDQTLAAETLNELGNAYVLLKQPSQAQKAYYGSIKAGLKSSDPTAGFLAEINLAQAFLELKDTSKAIALIQDYKRKSAYFKKWEAVANSYVILGKIAQSQGKNDLSVEYFEKSAYFGLRSNAFAIRSQALNNLAIVKFANGDNKNAERLFLNALKLRKTRGEVRLQSESLFNLAVFYEEIGKQDAAERWYRSAIAFAIEKNLGSELKDVAMALSDLYERQGKWSESNVVLEELVEQQTLLWSKKSDIENREFRQLEGLQEFLNHYPSEEKATEKNATINPWIWGVLAIATLIVIGIAFRSKRAN